MVGGGCVRVKCECGNWVCATSDEGRATCECGAVFAVTATQLTSPDGRRR